MKSLRAIVRKSGEEQFFEAQLLELDIAVASTTLEGLYKELECAIVMEYHIAKDLNQTPFAQSVRTTPHKFAAWWESVETDAKHTRVMSLPNEVYDALAIALHSPNLRPPLTIQEYAKAA